MKILASAFKSKKELFKYLVTNRQDILDMKKSTVKFTGANTFDYLPGTTNKAYVYDNNEETGIVKRTIVANTYNWLDSHDDVHLPNLFAKSIADRSGRIPHLHDHKFELAAKVGKLTAVREQYIKWKELGVNLKGTTMALVVESDIKKSYNEKIYDAYLHDEIDQHSIGMQYVKIELALNDEDYEQEFKVWNTYIEQIGNADKAVEQGYFFAVKAAKLIEVSAVLAGSNELTPTLTNNEKSAKSQTPKSTADTKEPSQAIPLDVDKLLTYYKI